MDDRFRYVTKPTRSTQPCTLRDR